MTELITHSLAFIGGAVALIFFLRNNKKWVDKLFGVADNIVEIIDVKNEGEDKK